jgi:hypothetical protein
MKKYFKQTQPHANLRDAMESGDHSKNGASPKSLMSRGKLLVLFFTVVLCLLSCEKNDVQIKTDLSEEEITTFYTRIESFVETPDFKLCNSIEELKPLIEKWLKQQPEVENVKIDGNILTLTLIGGGVTEIEFTEPEETVPEEPLDFEPEIVDGSYFTDSNASDAIHQEQAITKSQSTTRTATADETNPPNYVYPVFWEPNLDDVGFSLVPEVMKCINKSIFRKYTKLVAQDTQCNPSFLRTYLSPPGNPKPNLIFIYTHGSPGYLEIGSCKYYNNDQKDSITYKNIQSQLEKHGIDISKGKTKIRISKRKTRYIINLHADDLAKLLKGIDLSNSIVFLTACSSLSNTTLADVFINCGAAYVYGYSDIVNNYFPITYSLLSCLIEPSYLNSSPYATPKSTKEALDYIKAYTGLNQKNLLRGQGGDPNFKFKWPPITIATPRRNSVHTLTKSASQEPAVAMFGGHINYYSPGAGYSGNYCGFVYSSETDSPKFGDGKSYCVFTGLDHDVYDSEDYYLSTENIDYNTQYYYRAFVCSVYGDQAHIYYSEEVETFVVEKEEEEEIPKTILGEWEIHYNDPEVDRWNYSISIEENGVAILHILEWVGTWGTNGNLINMRFSINNSIRKELQTLNGTINKDKTQITGSSTTEWSYYEGLSWHNGTTRYGTFIMNKIQ